MISSSLSDQNDRAGIEAAHWLVALEDDPDNKELQTRFRSWLASDPRNPQAWTDTADIYGLMAAVPATSTVSKPVPPRRSPKAVLVMTAFALAASLAIVVLPGTLSRLWTDETTQTAQIRALQLADGSKIRLGPDSALDVDFHDGRRRIRLIRGEAFFEVEPDSGHPFIVTAGGVDTTVVGTAFNVSLEETGTRVAVQHGKVQVDGKGDSAILQAGDWVQMSLEGTVQRGHIPAAEVATWLDGQLVARDQPLAEVIDDLRRYYAGVIIVADASLAQRRVSGVYNLSEPVAALTAAVGAHGASVHSLTPWIQVVTVGD